MGYLDTWKVLDAIIADFREKGVNVPPETMADLRSAKTLISILLADSNCVSVKPRIEECLFNVESCIMAKGQTMFGIACVEKWANKLDQASKKPVDEGEETWSLPSKHGFPLGLPRGPNRVRISLLPQFQIDELRELADVLHLSCVPQKDGSLLLYGDNDQLKEFIKNVARAQAST